MGTGDILLGGRGGEPCDGVTSRSAILLGMLHATATGASSGRLGLWVVCAFTVYPCQTPFRVMGMQITCDDVTASELSIRELTRANRELVPTLLHWYSKRPSV